MKRTALLWVAVAAVIIVIGGCSNTELYEDAGVRAAVRTRGRSRLGRGRCEPGERRRVCA